MAMHITLRFTTIMLSNNALFFSATVHLDVHAVYTIMVNLYPVYSGYSK